MTKKSAIKDKKSPRLYISNDIEWCKTLFKEKRSMKKVPIVIHIPHGSTKIPSDIRADILLSDDKLNDELYAHTDYYTKELFKNSPYNYIINEYSRMVFDPERFRNDEDEVMAKYGQGAIYTKTTKGEVLRNLSLEKKEEMLQKYYDPYHKKFEELVQEVLDEHGKCLIIDAHSFAPIDFIKESEGELPDICIGTDENHTPIELANFTKKFFEKEEGIYTKINVPYGGSIVPLKFYGNDKRVTSIMIEINRSTYMNNLNSDKLKNYKRIEETITKYLQKIGSYYMKEDL
jgi:N-formylglutamate deformylase